jgi:hypothetical protein
MSPAQIEAEQAYHLPPRREPSVAEYVDLVACGYGELLDGIQSLRLIRARERVRQAKEESK